MIRSRVMLAMAALALLATMAAPAAAVEEELVGSHPLADLKRATAPYRNVARAIADGFEEFLECFDSPEGGMGQHYVDLSTLDDVVDPLRPEAMVYEVRGDTLGLVAVEWIVPGEATDHPPMVYDQMFHFNPDLGVWILHAWIWKYNPAGLFADFNPRVGPCP